MPGAEQTASKAPTATARVAVVTGAASGIGRELALACARDGKAVVAADVDRLGLAETKRLVEELGAPCVEMRCDVSKADEVERLADASWDRFGGVDWLFNNAAVAHLGPAWAATSDDWTWLWSVNVMGVANGIASFVPRLLQCGASAHIVNTSSAAGLATLSGSAVYCATKHAVVALSECLLADLKAASAPIGVSVLCPALVATNIGRSSRNRPAALERSFPVDGAYEERVRAGMAASPITARDVAEQAIAGVKAARFYIMPHEQTYRSVESRMQRILSDFAAARTAEET